MGVTGEEADLDIFVDGNNYNVVHPRNDTDAVHTGHIKGKVNIHGYRSRAMYSHVRYFTS